MTEERKQELFPYFAYMYSQQLDPDKYGSVGSIDEWSSLIQDNQNDMNQITEAASQLSDEEWDNLEQEYSADVSAPSEDQSTQSINQDAAYAKKGAKLKRLKEFSNKSQMMKSGGKKKKCECGCAVVTKKEKGGKIVDTCSCCGKDHSEHVEGTTGNSVTDFLKKGGYLNKKQEGGDVNSSAAQVGSEKCGGKMKKNRIKAAQEGTKFNGVMPTKTKQLPKMNAQSGANSSTVPTNPDGSAKEKTKLKVKTIVKKAMGGKAQFNGVIPVQTNKLKKTNSQSGANSSTVPTNPDGSAKTTPKIKKGQAGTVAPKPKKNVLPIVNGKKVPDDGADYSVQGPANKSEKAKKVKLPLKKEKGGELKKEAPNRIGKAKISTAKCGKKLKKK